MFKPSLFILAACAMLCSVAVAEPPQPEKIDLFEAGAGGYKSYRIPGIVVTAKGTVLAYCEARQDSAADWGEIHVLLRRSTDGGRTFDAPRKIAHTGPPIPRERFTHGRKPKNPDEQTVNNPVAIAGRDGTVHMLYCIEYAVCFYTRSNDDGQTWTAPVEITATFDQFRPEYPWHVLATGPGHGIELRTGRLVVPVWLCSGKGGAHRPSVTTTVFSDDQGKTWQRGEIAIPNTAEWVNPNETVVAELADGRVMLNARSESPARRRLVTISADGASKWSTPRFDEALYEPVCFASILRVPLKNGDETKTTLVFSNPDPSDKSKRRGERENLTLRVSHDDAATWPVARLLQSGPAGYSDLALLPDGSVLCFYERAKDNGKGAAERLTLARVPWEWLK